MARYTDQIGRAVEVPARPCRIVSLVPSLTELVCDLGLEDALVGLTKFCVHPEHIYRSRKRVGGTKDFKADLISELRPDFIIGNKEENPRSQILELAKSIPTWVTDVNDVKSAIEMIEGLGEVLRAREKSKELVNNIAQGFSALEKVKPEGSMPTALYLIWKNPYMAAGTDTFISSMMGEIGLRNALSAMGAKGFRYPRLDLETMAALRPDFILLSSEPYPFKKTDAEALTPYCHKAPYLVDGEAFSWYGSRMLKSIPILNRLVKSIGDSITDAR